MPDMQNLLGRIVEDSLNEVFIFDAVTYQFIQVNRGGRQNLGYSQEELRALTPIDIKPEFDQQSFDAMVQPLRDGSEKVLSFQTLHRRKDGSEYDV
jgi:PAS domain S-box-containing protein